MLWTEKSSHPGKKQTILATRCVSEPHIHNVQNYLPSERDADQLGSTGKEGGEEGRKNRDSRSP